MDTSDMMLPLMMMMNKKECPKPKKVPYVWGYDGERNGPDTWGSEGGFKECLKSQQSPIDIMWPGKGSEEQGSIRTRSGTTVTKCSPYHYRANLIVLGASSVFQNDPSKWGAHLALTDVSKTATDYWHSDNDDINPWIEFKISSSRTILYVEVVDRLDSKPDRYEKIEVRVGSSSSYDSAVSCGIKSFGDAVPTNPPHYKYTCPEDTRGHHVFIKKLGETEAMMHVNSVRIFAESCYSYTVKTITTTNSSVAQKYILRTNEGHSS